MSHRFLFRTPIYAAMLLLLALGATTTAYGQTACGGAGQRGCCNGDFEFSNIGLACNSGLVQVAGCDSSISSCSCAGGFITSESSSGTCVQPTACGGPGQRACCIGVFEYSSNGATCNSGLTEIPGCVGDCTCGVAGTGQLSTSSCMASGSTAEPGTNSTPAAQEAITPWTLPQTTLPTGPECPAGGLCGFADLHVHMFANMAHGEGTLAGAPWDPKGIAVALGPDYGSLLPLVDKNGTPKLPVDGSAGILGPQCPSYLTCTGEVLFHGDHTAIDSTTGGGTNDGASSNFGFPLFNGWPQWTSTTHQQVYYKWLERAWLGGLRLIVQDAVTNEALCKSSTHVAGVDCTDSMSAIDAQITAAFSFQQWLDSQYGGAGQGWYQIVTTPAQANAVIEQGKLAVVLGIEVDNLFNCHLGSDTGAPPSNEGVQNCTPAFLQGKLQTYYNMGVRHIFPIHNFDNAYGNAAAWQDPISVGNFVSEGQWWLDGNCSGQNYGFALSNLTETALLLLGFGKVDAGNSYYPSSNWATCNGGQGLTNLGGVFIQQAMRLGMIIDVDHMSINSLNTTLSLAAANNYPGIAATHVQFFDLYAQNYTGPGSGRHERMRTQAQLQTIKSLGGMIAVMLKDDVQDTGNGYCVPGGTCPFGAGNRGLQVTNNYNGPNNNYGLLNSCNYSTTEWIQAYLFGADSMGGSVAMGSDFNGIAGHVGPRFGPGACGGNQYERSRQEKSQNRLQYPFTIPGFGTFDRQQTGQRTFDFNTDGLAHIGLLPDLIADLKNVGATDAQLQPLFGSAQAYINMWSKVSPSAPVITSASSFTIQENLFGSLPLTAIGIPTPTLSVQGALPSGVSFDGHNLQGRPATGTAGTYPLIVTASNGITPDATQNFSLKITPGYAFLNSSTTTFQVGVANSFTTFTDAPNPDGNNFTHGPGSGNAYGAPNYLPAGLSYNSSGVLSGTAPAFSGGVIPLVFFRGNVPGQQQGLVQNFNLVIVEAPSIAGPSTQNFTVGKASSFSAAATSGYPAPSVTIGGTLPAGVTYNAVSGMVSGTALSGTGGTYPLSFEAVNGVQPNFFKSVSLVVSEAPIIQTANNTTFTSGINNSFTATASGYPAPNLQLSGTLPAGVSVTSNTGANNISTLVLSGNPASSVGGIYKFSLVASGTTPPNAAQNFTLTVNSPPTFTGVINPTFVVGASGAFSVTATGYPVPTFSVAGALPSGLSFNSATGAITGIPAAGATGSYPITITAGNGILPNATQNSTLVVKQPAGITSASSATFTVGSSSVFHITTTDPAATVSYTGTLPVGVIFFNGILGGTPVSGSAGVYPITFQASLATGSVVTQSFVLTVAKIMPAITWNPPAPMSFGGGLGSAQLNATAAIQGTYLYTPPAGTVLPPGDGQLLSVVFKPANMTDYVATTVTTTVSISPIPPTAQPVNLVSTPVLSRDANFNLVVTLTVANAGISTAQNVTITSLNVGTSIAPGFPVNLGAMPSGAIVTYTTTLPASSVGAAGTGSSLTLAGIYSGGTFNCAVRLVFP